MQKVRCWHYSGYVTADTKLDFRVRITVTSSNVRVAAKGNWPTEFWRCLIEYNIPRGKIIRKLRMVTPIKRHHLFPSVQVWVNFQTLVVLPEQKASSWRRTVQHYILSIHINHLCDPYLWALVHLHWKLCIWGSELTLRPKDLKCPHGTRWGTEGSGNKWSPGKVWLQWTYWSADTPATWYKHHDGSLFEGKAKKKPVNNHLQPR